MSRVKPGKKEGVAEKGFFKIWFCFVIVLL